MTDSTQPSGRLVVIAMNHATRDGEIWEVITHLADQRRAELCGVFVMDENLLRLAELPFAREIGQTSAVARPLDRSALTRRLHAEAEELRQTLTSVAQRARVACSFRVTRGTAVQVVHSADDQTEITVVGIPEISTFRLGTREPATVGSAPIAVLSPTMRREDSINLAASLAQAGGRELFVLAEEPDDRQIEDRQVTGLSATELDMLRQQWPSVRIRAMAWPGARGQPPFPSPALVILARDRWVRDEAWRARVERAFRCPVVVVHSCFVARSLARRHF